MGELAHAAEGQKRAEAQRRGRVGILERVANQNAVLVVLEQKFLLQNDASHAIDGGGNLVAVKLADVFMPLRAVVVALILVQAEVELCAVLHHRAVERGEQHVVLVVELRHGHHEQSVILADVAIDDGGARVGSRAVRAQQFLGQRILQVGHQGLFKSQITHRLYKLFFR